MGISRRGANQEKALVYTYGSISNGITKKEEQK
jgi:hypothetical protein